MKRNILYIVMAFAAVCMISCDRTATYYAPAYASFYSNSYSVDETAGQVVIPVVLNNGSGSEVQISVSVAENSTAAEGVDYEIVSPASGLLTFSGDTDSLAVVVDIKSHVGEFTGAKNLQFNLASLSDGVGLGVFSTASVSITDLDHPLSGTGLLGEWEGTLMFASNPPTPLPAVLKFSIDTEDETYTKMILEGWEVHPNYAGYSIPVSAVYDEKTSCVYVTAGQTAWVVNDYYNFIFAALNDAGNAIVDLTLAYDKEAGTLTQMNMFGAYNTQGETEDELGFYSLYNPGTVFTKK